MNLIEYNTNFFTFLESSPTAYHAVSQMVDQLQNAGFIALDEGKIWTLEQGKSYFLTRDSGALIAFRLGSKVARESDFRMLAAHSDSPGLQIKPKADKKTDNYLQLGVEVYGSPLYAPWFDRELSLAGRVCCQLSGGTTKIFLVDFQRPLLVIPSLALHFDRSANEGKIINAQNHLAPLLAQMNDEQKTDFSTILKNRLIEQYPGTDFKTVLGFEIFCYDVQKPSFLGLNNEFICAAKLDNLLSCHAAISALIEDDCRYNSLFFCANHEENGSVSTTGARGTFLESTLQRLFPDPEIRQIALHRSFLFSLDNAHASHPNFRDMADPQHNILLNHGPVIKINANQRYATNSVSSSIFKIIAEEADIPVQEFVMRSDLACGSTIGPLTAARLGVSTIDIGAPTLAMHSIRELTGSKDPHFLYKTISQFLATESDFWPKV